MDGRVKLAQAMMKAGNYGPATTVLSQHLRSRPQDLDALFLYGTALFRAKNHSGAEVAFRRITVARPTSARAHFSLGVSLLELGRLDDARNALQRALDLNPNLHQARVRLAEIAAATGTPNPPPKPLQPPAEEARLNEGDLVHRGHRRLSSFAGRFLQAIGIGALGYWLAATAQPGRLRWLAENPPLQFPSIGFLRGRFEATGLDIHRRELEEALVNAANRSELFDALLDGLAVGLVVLGAVVILHALLASRMTTYEVYQRRIDVRKGVLNRRRFDAWLFEITDVELRQSPMLTLTRNAEVTIHLEQTSVDKPSRFNDRFKLRIIGFGTLREQERFFAELRNAALKERRALKNWFL